MSSVCDQKGQRATFLWQLSCQVATVETLAGATWCICEWKHDSHLEDRSCHGFIHSSPLLLEVISGITELLWCFQRTEIMWAPLLWHAGVLHFCHTDAVVRPPTQSFPNETPHFESGAALPSWLDISFHLSLCLKLSAPFDSTIEKSLPFTETFCLHSVFWHPLSQQVYFLTLSFKAEPHTPVSFPNPVSSSHLFSSSIIPPQLFLSYCLYSCWQAYVRELLVKSITIVLHRAKFGSMTRQMSVEIFWCPS